MLKFIKCLIIKSFLIVFALGMSSCSHDSVQPVFHSRVPGQTNNIEGKWADENGITSSFSNGIFITRSADTNEKLAEGNYVLHPYNTIEIEMRSLVRGITSHVSCSFSSRTSLLCTTGNGAQFLLTRVSS